MEAINLVNEDPLGPDITDEEKWSRLLESKQSRRPVSHFVETLTLLK